MENKYWAALESSLEAVHKAFYDLPERDFLGDHPIIDKWANEAEDNLLQCLAMLQRAREAHAKANDKKYAPKCIAVRGNTAERFMTLGGLLNKAADALKIADLMHDDDRADLSALAEDVVQTMQRVPHKTEAAATACEAMSEPECIIGDEDGKA